MKSTILITVCIFFTCHILCGQEAYVNENIFFYFNEIKEATKNNIKLWEKDLYGGILLVDPKTRQVFANEPDTADLLKSDGSIYSGILPGNINVANTSLNWSGKRWAMIMLPISENKHNRINLLTHELFHSAQPSLGFNINNPENIHLDQKDGRIYLRLELEALLKAAQSKTKKELQKNLTNALTFRKYRHNLFENSNMEENQLELNEGIAEYTGMIHSGRNKIQQTAHFVNETKEFFTNPTYVRSFAYHTVPIYGYLLKNTKTDWNKEISMETDLTDFFIDSFNIRIPNNLEKGIKEIFHAYNGATITEEETDREEYNIRLVTHYKNLFIEQPHFEIVFENMNVSFDPRNIIPLEDSGTVYPNIRVTDNWGILTVENGALMSPNWDKISLTIPINTEDRKIIGEGWILEMTNDYSIEKDEISGNYKLIKN